MSSGTRQGAPPASPPLRLLAIMGSGETSPTMVKTHRSLFDRLGPPPVPAVILDTPFGFQANATDIAARAVTYFRESVGVDVAVASYRSAELADTLATEYMLAQLRAARYVFAGPGSPTYTLRQWASTPVPEVLVEKLSRGGCVTFASAAALTLGVATVPVYEIYKVGEDPHWVDGLDLLAAAGLSVAVIPHYDNTEGGTHDTRYCYLGEHRLAAMERDLPDGAFVLGVDEHTALVLDLGTGTAEVVGRGVVTVRSAGGSVEVPSGSTVDVDQLRQAAHEPGRLGRSRPSSVPAPSPSAPPPRSPLLEEVERLQGGFDTAMADLDVGAAAASILELDSLIVDWSRDTLQSDQPDRARSVMRSMVVLLGELAAVGAQDPRPHVGPFIDALLELRQRARDDRDWATADDIRRRLAATGVEVRDTPEGTRWSLLSLASPQLSRAPIVQRPRTPPFQGGNTGSNPVGGAESPQVPWCS